MPYALLNWATKVLAYQMWSISFLPLSSYLTFFFLQNSCLFLNRLYMMAKHAKELRGSKYEQLIEENEEFYSTIKAKLNSYFASSPQEARSAPLYSIVEDSENEDESA